MKKVRLVCKYDYKSKCVGTSEAGNHMHSHKPLPLLLWRSWFPDESQVTWHGRFYWERSNLQGQDQHERRHCCFPTLPIIHGKSRTWAEAQMICYFVFL